MPSSIPILQSAVLSLNAVGVWDMYLMMRQRRTFKSKTIPDFYKEHVTEEEFTKAQAYGHDRSSFSLLEKAKDLLVSNAGLLFKFSARLYSYVAKCTGLPVGGFAHNYATAVATDVLATVIDLPFSYYSTFVLEEQHGFNKMTKLEFFKDMVKSFVLRATLLYPAQIALIQFVVRKFGERFPLYFFGGMSMMLFAFLLIFPTVIQPLFNTFTPLDKESSLHKKIDKLCESLNFPLTKVYVVDGSRRSHHSNAYFYGFGKNKRIVLYDTLLEQMKDNEDHIIAVLCHELGHYMHGHIYMNLAMFHAQLLAISFGAGAVVFNKKVYEAFGFTNMDPVVGMNLFVEALLAPLLSIMNHFMCWVSRRNEFQADRYAVEQGYGEEMKASLMLITKENKGSMMPDPLYSAMNYSHPPTKERCEAVDAHMKKLK